MLLPAAWGSLKRIQTKYIERDIAEIDMDCLTKTAKVPIAEIVTGRLPASEIHGRLSGGESISFLSSGPDETFFLGHLFGGYGQPGEVYTLTGDLGTGKTLFTQGFAAGLGITEPVNSPTFTILQTYESGRLPFYHFDVYRIGDVEEMEEVGWEDCIYGGGICIVEWAELIQDVLPEGRFHILIEKDLELGFDHRRITIHL